MRFLLIAWVALVAGCHGGRTASHAAAPIAPGFPATRWVPAHPTYVLAAPTLREGQRALIDIIDALGAPLAIDAAAVGQGLGQLIAIDPLRPDALTAAGIDLEGGFVVFSEDVAPTFVVHLSSPEGVQAFFDTQRERGLVTQSVVVEGTEVFTAQLPAAPSTKVSWAIAADWLWVHVSVPVGHDEGAAWFASSFRADRPAWAEAWRWATTAAPGPSRLFGFIELTDLLTSLTAKAPAALACAKLVAPARRIALSASGGPRSAAGTLAIDLGDAAPHVASALLPVPEGFATLVAGAPLAVQWNLDLVAVRAWMQPCLAAAGMDAGALDRAGVRAFRAVLRTFDPDDRSGTGALSLDLVHDRYVAELLDRIPLRSTLERSRTFGPHQGHHLAVPMVATFDYVLGKTLALAGVGDGLLASLVGSGKLVPGPLAAIDIVPPALPPATWKQLLALAGMRGPDEIAERLGRWRDGHIAVTIAGSSLVVTAAGNRR